MWYSSSPFFFWKENNETLHFFLTKIPKTSRCEKYEPLKQTHDALENEPMGIERSKVKCEIELLA